MLTLGLFYATYALAQAPEPVTYNPHVDYNENIIFNRLGNPEGYVTALHASRQRPTVVKNKANSLRCYCLAYAKAVSGINIGSVGYAAWHPVNTQVPTVGAIIFLNEGYNVWDRRLQRNVFTGHAGVVTAVTDTTITIVEANYSPCKVGNRTLKRNYFRIRGFYTNNLPGLPT